MAYDEGLAQRVRELLHGQPSLAERKMFGGIGWLLQGNMACGVHGEGLIVRVGPERYEAALAEPHAGVFDLTGRPMTGWVIVGPGGCSTEEALADWVQRGVAFAGTLPPK